MKIRLLIGTFFTISFFSMKAQETSSADFNLKTVATDKIDFTEIGLALQYHKRIDDKNQLTNTFEYSNLNVNYELGSFTTYENLNRFNQLKNQTNFLHQFSNTTKVNFSLTPILSFQQNPNISDFSILGSLEIIQHIDSNISLALGAARATVFGYPGFIPVASLNFKINNKSTLLIGFPNSKLSYSNTIRNKFNVSNSFNGNFYNLDQTTSMNTATRASLSQMTSAFEYERNVDKNWFLHFKAGYDFNKKYNLIDSENHKIYDFNSGNGYTLGIGIKYKQ
ncbi:DUF6268 family outer membrane beta-barrel protein [Flavobacterium branchiicola]|uniref:DUF6268 family outer membrane beta-barrel protein n=1 Tax=Flavobacterium branchiicola TaxID=1114875 RepID=A0ABV9PB87_9FLAO|nr:DUF6268 family outer membrane beta-barrel protein [Flavobacterium branchiicola]MBS7252631.1 hypothetical protein [Flavobacterium branchiicola]